MTRADEPLNNPGDNPLGAGDRPMGIGVSPAQEGVTLQRGGEELQLVKAGDRFTVRLLPGTAPHALAEEIGATAMQVIASVELVEFQIAPSQLESAMQTARSHSGVVFASHVYQLANYLHSFLYLTDELTVQFAGDASRTVVRAMMQELGLKVFKTVPGVPFAYVFRVGEAAIANPIKLANQLMRRSEVLTAEPNVAIQTQPQYRPADPLYPQQWYLQHRANKAGLVANSHISAEDAWDITRGLRTVVVAIADDGFDLNHPDFQGRGKIAFPKDFRGNDFLPSAEGREENHGTACAGVAIAEENGSGVVGVAPGCTFMPLRTTGYLDDATIEELFNWAIDKGAWVISCSWGPSAVYFPLSLRQSAMLTRAATAGRNGKGCVVVFAVGNANRPISGTVNEQGWQNNVLRGPTRWMNGYTIHPDVIAVSACTSLNRKSAYSNWGNTVSVCAPSNNGHPGMWLAETGFIPTAPKITAQFPGEGVYTSDRLGAAGYSAGDFTSDFGGTSSACPVVAGVAALVLSANPNLTAREVKQILQDSADKIVDSSTDPQLGFKRGTYDEQGHSQWFGYGKVNAHKAVLEAQRRQAPLPLAVRTIQGENLTPVSIPDFNLRGITSRIQIGDRSLIRNLSVTVDVEHSFLGDLEISLISPDGTTILLQGRTLGRRTRLQMTYTLQNTPLLKRFLNQVAIGQWQLKLVDHAQAHVGRLRGWQLSLGV